MIIVNNFSKSSFFSFLNYLWAIILCATILSACIHNTEYVEESRTLKSVKAAFEHSKHDIYKAYSKALSYVPDLQGRVMFLITIDPNGRVKNVSIVESTLNNDKVLREVSGIIKNINFGKVRHGESVALTWPIEFLPR